MKHLKTILLATLATALTLLFVSCGKVRFENASDTIHEQIGVATAPPYAQVDVDPTKYTAPPAVGIFYQYKVGGEGLVAAHSITSGNFSWTVTYDNGTGKTTHVDGYRPCDAPSTQHIPLKRVAEYGYTVNIALEEEIIRNYTLKAYPVGNYNFDGGTDCTVKDGKLAVLKVKYYYELVIEYIQGKVVYGFFID